MERATPKNECAEAIGDGVTPNSTEYRADSSVSTDDSERSEGPAVIPVASDESSSVASLLSDKKSEVRGSPYVPTLRAPPASEGVPESAASDNEARDDSLTRPGLSESVCKPNESTDLPLTRLENVTALSRSLICPDIRKKHKIHEKVDSSLLSTSAKRRLKGISTSKKHSEGTDVKSNRAPSKDDKKKKTKKKDNKKKPQARSRSRSRARSASPPRPPLSQQATRENHDTHPESKNRRRSRSSQPSFYRSRSLSRKRSEDDNIVEYGDSRKMSSESRSGFQEEKEKPYPSSVANNNIIVQVISCRSDEYYKQQKKAPGSKPKLPHKAPAALMIFHELAIGIKDAYYVGGVMPLVRPQNVDYEQGKESGILDVSQTEREEKETEGRTILQQFMENLNFLLALVDEIILDTAVRGALKADSAFKCIRDVIRTGNELLESMLVRREGKYALFFRLVQPSDNGELKEKMKTWNVMVDEAVTGVTDKGVTIESDTDGQIDKTGQSSPSGNIRRGIVSRGRSMLPAIARLRRSTPDPGSRARKITSSMPSFLGKMSAVDSSSVGTASTVSDLTGAKLEISCSDKEEDSKSQSTSSFLPRELQQPLKSDDRKEKLVEIISSLKDEKQIMDGRDSDGESNAKVAPLAEIPTAAPKLPSYYIHRHKPMKRVVDCLLNTNDETSGNRIITVITSHHWDKAGTGKTTVAVAAIQTVEVRARFSDGIAWIKLGGRPLTEGRVRALYEELHRQLLTSDCDRDDLSQASSKAKANANDGEKSIGMSSLTLSLNNSNVHSYDEEHTIVADSLEAYDSAESRRRFHIGELEGIKEDLGRMLANRRVLICLDDVRRVEDAQWFIFDTHFRRRHCSARHKDAEIASNVGDIPFRILITTRTPSLFGSSVAQVVFVRIFSEREAIKLFLACSGCPITGGRNSIMYTESAVIVKGCGHSPLAICAAAGILRRDRSNWKLWPKTWKIMVEQSNTILEEAVIDQSFENAFKRIVDLGFLTVEELNIRAALRWCFVTFAMVFCDSDRNDRGFPEAVVLKLFSTVLSAVNRRKGANPKECQSKLLFPETMVKILETMNLLQTVRTDLRPLFKSNKIKKNHESRFYVMHDVVKIVAEDIARRPTHSFAPLSDDFAPFASMLESEESCCQDDDSSTWSAPLRNAAKYLVQQLTLLNENGPTNSKMKESQFHELMVACLRGIEIGVGEVPPAVAIKFDALNLGGGQLEEYILEYLPTHLIRAKALSSAGNLLLDADFISRRVYLLGAVKSTKRQIADLLHLRRELLLFRLRSRSTYKGKRHAGQSSTTKHERLSPARHGHSKSCPSSPTSVLTGVESEDSVEDKPRRRSHGESSTSLLGSKAASTKGELGSTVDVNRLLREGCRVIIDEVFRVGDVSSTSKDSLNMAICLSSVGDCLLECGQSRDAMLRLEEAVGIYRGFLGPYHIDVARALHGVGRALEALGEIRVALLKFSEASRIYEACNAIDHFDCIVNYECIATALAAVDDWEKAKAKYEDIIVLRQNIYGQFSIPVAKTINDYAICLAKHGRMDEALRQFKDARTTYELAAKSLSCSSRQGYSAAEYAARCASEVTLINLNISSIDRKGEIALDGRTSF